MKILNFFCIFLFVFYSNILFSQQPKISFVNFYICNGNIGSSEISMYLYREGTNIAGKYYYKNINQFIDIEGYINQNKLYIEEKVNNRITGYFNGIVSNDSFFSGEWTSQDGENKYDFYFYRNESYPINNLNIINSTLEINFDNNRKFISSKDSIILNNEKNLNNLDRISLDVDGIKSLNTNRIAYILNNSIIDEYNVWKRSSYNKDDFHLIKEIDVSYLDENIISFSIYNYSYTGGMHGIYNVAPAIYLISTGEKIGTNLSELVENQNDRELINLMRSKLLRNFTEKDFFDFYSIRLSDIYDITPSGIKFIWPLYKIADYAQGVIEIDFTYLELRPFVRKDSKFWYLFNK
ncbi:dynein heavy chain [Brachyspira suanatina]|uniref:Dynein heavy chain n=1 Tax=Brachyspira suanatina TaxID=381802 RepID=A0A0G4K9E2_9SPIR|nr:DUF4163 domain-containing protein [Brachyspira suanatina]CRF34389.1 dynein heavy chain [Brachyspira suanatina]